MSLHFMNSGEFDVRAMLTFGVSAKESTSAIGYFGTGFKYAVAIILRLGGKICIETKGKTYEFTTRKEEIRGQEFELVCMNGDSVGFTTRLGIGWEPWMAFRELYCNCKDEGGEISVEKSEAFDTCVTIDCSPVEAAWKNRAEFFLEGEPAWSIADVEIYRRPSMHFFYKGIAVRTLPRPGIFTYNIKSFVTLTEDRLAAHAHQLEWPVKRALQNADDREVCMAVVTATPDSMEGRLSYDSSYGVSQTMLGLLRERINSAGGLSEELRELLKALDAKNSEWREFELSRVQAAMLEKSFAFLESLDANPRQFPIKTVESLGAGVMGRALDGTIYVSKLAFNQGTKQVASTLFEEWLHCSHGFADFDRGMQNWLFDKILSLGEEIAGEPL